MSCCIALNIIGFAKQFPQNRLPACRPPAEARGVVAEKSESVCFFCSIVTPSALKVTDSMRRCTEYHASPSLLYPPVFSITTLA